MLADVERTLTDRRKGCFSSAFAAVDFSVRACSEFVLVGLGEGIPVTEIGRILGRVSREDSRLAVLESLGRPVLDPRSDSFDVTLRRDATDFFCGTTGGGFTFFQIGTTDPFLGLLSVMASRPGSSLSCPFRAAK